MSAHENIERIILRRLRGGPRWAHSFVAVKVVTDRLCRAGLVEKIAPPGGRSRNMLGLTDKGMNRLDALEVKS